MTLKQQLKKFLKENSRGDASFTLIELVIVLGILAVLAVVVILVLNPSEFLKQARDSNRLSDLQTLNSVIGQYQADGGTSIGSSNTVYVSIPSSQSNCSDLGLPVLPVDWFYACSSSDNYRKVTGNGWIPINLTSVSYGSPLDALPIDPINSTSTGDYYTYVTGGSWELNGILESSKYRTNTSITKQNLPGVFAVGSNLTLSPIFNNSGLVGYWKFDEGSGTTTYDSSGNNNTGTLAGYSAWQTESNCKIGKCLSFPVYQSDVSFGSKASLNTILSQHKLTYAGWVYWLGTEDWGDIVGFAGYAPHYGYAFTIYPGGHPQLRYQDSGGNWIAPTATNLVVPTNQWVWLAVTYDASASKVIFYLNDQSQTVSNSVIADNTGCIFMAGMDGWSSDTYIDELRVYNRALSAAEIAAIYNATK